MEVARSPKLSLPVVTKFATAVVMPLNALVNSCAVYVATSAAWSWKFWNAVLQPVDHWLLI